jgi:hypothetical protein
MNNVALLVHSQYLQVETKNPPHVEMDFLFIVYKNVSGPQYSSVDE